MNEILNQLIDNERWPSLKDHDHLNELNLIADEAFEKHTLEGYLAALLIYHQLCEEIIKLLLRDSEFLIQVRVYPASITFPKQKRLMFGRAIEQLKHSIDFYEKNEFIEKCSSFNKIRNEVVHKLTKDTSITELREKMVEVQNSFNEIYYLWNHCHDWFLENFKATRKNLEFLGELE